MKNGVQHFGKNVTRQFEKPLNNFVLQMYNSSSNQALVAQEIEVPPPTGLTSVRNTELVAPSIYHDTTDEQLRAEGYLHVNHFRI
jgi:hypothetical protein